MEISGILPHVNQCEFHPFQNPWHLRQFCEDHDIHFGVDILLFIIFLRIVNKVLTTIDYFLGLLSPS